jgi:hypothetical protein
MTQISADDLFRQDAEVEGGMPVSVGARMAHIRMALATGRALYVDLSVIPEKNRAAVAAEIKELVNRASVRTQQQHLHAPTPDAPKMPR